MCFLVFFFKNLFLVIAELVTILGVCHTPSNLFFFRPNVVSQYNVINFLPNYSSSP